MERACVLPGAYVPHVRVAVETIRKMKRMYFQIFEQMLLVPEKMQVSAIVIVVRKKQVNVFLVMILKEDCVIATKLLKIVVQSVWEKFVP
jgi:hypothetical protein